VVLGQPEGSAGTPVAGGIAIAPDADDGARHFPELTRLTIAKLREAEPLDFVVVFRAVLVTAARALNRGFSK
jgi:hypothetical protein